MKTIIGCIILIIIIMIGCESKSGRRIPQPVIPLEKIVIIDSALGSVSDNYIRYKVKRISKGVVTFVSIPKGEGGRYEKNDTIFYKFN